jgi:hypothetical protein
MAPLTEPSSAENEPAILHHPEDVDLDRPGKPILPHIYARERARPNPQIDRWLTAAG